MNANKAYLCKGEKHLQPYGIIKAAVNGDSDAICAVLRHYGPYIRALSMRQACDGNGISRFYVNEDIRLRLEAKLITRILSFKVI